jgi:hypothetical protein
MRLRQGLIVLLLMVYISSCVSVGASRNNCSWVKPILLEEKDDLTTATARSILTHNETWDELCN